MHWYLEKKAKKNEQKNPHKNDKYIHYIFTPTENTRVIYNGHNSALDKLTDEKGKIK